MGLVLSLFPGIGLLDMAFEEAGFCVVRGPDLLWGGDVRRFHPPAGRFDGVIGGPPCPAHSHLGKVVAAAAGDNVAQDMTPDFLRCVREAAPRWFLMENVPGVPDVAADGFLVTRYELDNRIDCGGDQRRRRAFQFGSVDGRALRFDWWRPPTPAACIPTVTANATVWKNGRAYGEKSSRYLREVMLPAQGLPPDFLEDSPFTLEGKIRVVGNGVPLPMGRAVAEAVKRALSADARAA
jgi:DNA (cytosine-5)-methyltransferase 1